MLRIKLLIYVQNQPQLNCIEFDIHSHIKLKQIGNFLYQDQKINFNDYVFCSGPIKKRNTELYKQKQKNRSKGKKYQQDEEMRQEEVTIFKNQQTIGSIKNQLKVEQSDGDLLLILYSKKEFDSIMNLVHNGQQVSKSNVRSEQRQPVHTYRDKRQSECEVY